MSEALLEALKKGALLVFNPRRDSPVESSFHPVDPSIYLTALGEEMESIAVICGMALKEAARHQSSRGLSESRFSIVRRTQGKFLFLPYAKSEEIVRVLIYFTTKEDGGLSAVIRCSCFLPEVKSIVKAQLGRFIEERLNLCTPFVTFDLDN